MKLVLQTYLHAKFHLDPSYLHVGIGPRHNVLDGDPAPPKGHTPPIFGPYLLWPNGWMD